MSEAEYLVHSMHMGRLSGRRALCSSLGIVREKVGDAEGKMHCQLFCSHKTKNHHKLK